MSLTYEEVERFFAEDCGDEENWPISKQDLLDFFESDEETARYTEG